MSYDADDPNDTLGGKSKSAPRAGLPSGPFRGKGQLRALTGDVRNATAANQTFQLIDIEYDLPKVLMIQGRVLPQPSAPPMPNDGYPAFAHWKISTGLDRSPLVILREFDSSRFSMTVVARSVQLLATSLPPPEDDPFSNALPYTIQSLVTPMDVTCDVGNLNALNTSLASQAPNQGIVFFADRAVNPGESLDFLLDAEGADPLIFGRGIRRGFSVFNDSAVALKITLGEPTTFGAFSNIIAAGGYFEAPYNYSGKVSYAFPSAGVGKAYFTVYGASP